MSSRNDYWAYLQPRDSDLSHHGVKGMKWGVRKDRYESYRTRRLRRNIEEYDKDLNNRALNTRSLKRLSRKRDKLYSKYNKQKTRDYSRKVMANSHPSHLRNVGSFVVHKMGITIGVGAAGGIAYAALGNNPANMKSIVRGARVATTLLGAQNIYKHVERARAIEGVKNDGRYDLTRR